MVWHLEQDWPDYEGPDESGPEIWYFFQDRLAFALGQLEAWDALAVLRFPENHLLVARIYLVLGTLQVNDPEIFYGVMISTLFCVSAQCLRNRAIKEQVGMEADPFVEPARVKRLLTEHFGLSPTEQEEYLVRFPKAWNERATESQSVPHPGARYGRRSEGT